MNRNFLSKAIFISFILSLTIAQVSKAEPGLFGKKSNKAETQWVDLQNSPENKSIIPTESAEPEREPQVINFGSDFYTVIPQGLMQALTPPSTASVTPSFEPLFRIALFPVVSRGIKGSYFAIAQAHNPQDFYKSTQNPTSVHFSATVGLLHIKSLKTGDLLAEGRDLKINVNKGFIVDNQYPIHSYEDLVIMEDSSEVTHFAWDKVKGVDYPGSFTVIADKMLNRKILRVNNIIGMEPYTRGVIPGEMQVIDFRYMAAYEAQAVATRTFALNKTEYMRCDASKLTHQCRRSGSMGSPFEFNDSGVLPYDVVGNTSDQLYAGLAKVTPLTDKAATLTENEIIVNQNYEVLPAEFRSKTNRLGRMSQQSVMKEARANPYEKNFYKKILVDVYTIKGNKKREGVLPQVVKLRDIKPASPQESAMLSWPQTNTSSN